MAKGLADGVLEALSALKDGIPSSLPVTISLITSVIGLFTTERERSRSFRCEGPNTPWDPNT